MKVFDTIIGHDWMGFPAMSFLICLGYLLNFAANEVIEDAAHFLLMLSLTLFIEEANLHTAIDSVSNLLISFIEKFIDGSFGVTFT